MSNFKSDINNLLHEIDILYPEKRKKENKDKLSRFWSGKPADESIPYIVQHLPVSIGERNYLPILNYDEDRNNLLTQLAGICGHSIWNDNYIPLLQFGCRQCLLPSLLGCDETHINGDYSTVPIIKDASDVYKLKRVENESAVLGGIMLEKMKLFNELCDGRVILAENDMQGPFSVASQIWGIQNFIYAIYDEEEAVRKLLDITTELVIEYLHRQRDVTKGNWSPCHCMPTLWLDEKYGVCVSEDLLDVVSPEIAEEFIIPYLRKIGKEFGGCLVHTCGSLNHSINKLTGYPEIIGVNCSQSETDIKKLVENGGDGLCYAFHSAYVTCNGLPRLGIKQQMENGVKVLSDTYAGVLMITDVLGELDIERDPALLKELSRIKH